MRTKIALLESLAILALFCGLHAHGQIARPRASPFDRPMRHLEVDLGLSEFYEPIQNMHSYLTCYYYAHFLVKQLDLRQKGAEWVGIVPIPKGEAPKCNQAKEKSEIRLDQKDWEGYFSGVVGNLVFIDDADGLNGSIGYVVFDATSGRELFRDQAERKIKMKGGRLVWEGQRLRIERSPHGAPVLSYIRAYFADCSLQKDGAACWSKIRAATKLPAMAVPACTGEFKDDPDDPSVVFFPVRVVLGSHPEPEVMPGRVRCQAQE